MIAVEAEHTLRIRTILHQRGAALTPAPRLHLKGNESEGLLTCITRKLDKNVYVLLKQVSALYINHVKGKRVRRVHSLGGQLFFING